MATKNYHDDLSHIRTMMERSSRFISLSGLSGVFAGLSALAGTAWVYFLFQRNGLSFFDLSEDIFSPSLVRELIGVAVAVLLLALFSAYFFTTKKSRQKNLKVWDSTTKRLLWNFSVPLIAGGIFCLGLLYHHLFLLLMSATLIFYGLALVSAERFTLTDVKYLGYCLLNLGFLALFFPGLSFIFWSFGFGVLHIVYGLVMYKKYK